MSARLLFILLYCSVSACLNAAMPEIDSLQKKLEDYVNDKDARIGVAVIVNGKDTVEVNGYSDFPMLSVFKFPQALAVVDFCNKKGCSLDSILYISADKIRENTWSPMREKYGSTDIFLPVRDLLEFSVVYSDNNACDILFDFIGGVSVADSLMKAMGYDNIVMNANEDDMHRDLYLCYTNRSTPVEMAALSDRFNTGIRNVSDGYSFIAGLMESCATGQDRLASVLSGERGIVLGHKTGTGDINSQGKIIAVNDAGYFNFPDGNRYAIAVFVADSGYDLKYTSNMIADISEIVFSTLPFGKE